MKILAIRGKNIASLEGEFEIDFTTEPLQSTGIFAISGPTGAGKSTLLDTMCLALFARTPRTHQAKENKIYIKDVSEEQLGQNDPRFLLRRGTASGYAEVDFYAMNGSSYRARWSVLRAREKESGRLQNYRITLFNLDHLTEEQGNNKDLQNRIVELIGLTFDQFTRSVLLAQNDFSTFLKAEQGEKASLLEKLTGTELYSDISKMIFEKNNRAKADYEEVNARIQGIEIITEEDELRLRETVAGLEKKHHELEKKKQQKVQLQDKVKSVNELIVQKEADQVKAVEQMKIASDGLNKSALLMTQGKEELEKTETVYAKIQPEIIDARKLDVEIDSWLPVVEEAAASYRKQEQLHLHTRNDLDSNLKQTAELQEEQKRLINWFEKYRQKENIARQLNVLLLHLDAAFNYRQVIVESTKKVEDLQKKIDSLRSESGKLQNLLQLQEQKNEILKEGIKKLAILCNPENEIKINEALEANRSQREKLLIELTRFEANGDIKTLRQNLVEGTPCPVCGSEHHPYATAEVNRKMLELHETINRFTLQIGELTRQGDEFRKLQNQLKVEQQALVEGEKESASLSMKSIQSKNNELLLENQLQSENKVIAEQHQQLTISLQATSALFGNDEWQDKWKENPEKFRKTLTTFTGEWNENQEKLQQADKLLHTLLTEQSFKQKSLEQSTEQLKVLRENLESKQNELQLKQKIRKGLLNGKSVDEIEDTFRKQIENLKRRQEENQKIQTQHQATVEQCKGVIERITQEIRESRETLKEQTDLLNAWLTENDYPEEGVHLEDALESCINQKNEIYFKLRVQEDNKKKVAAFQDELENRRTIYERWSKLNDLAGSSTGDKFRRIAQGYTLDVLLNYANVQLKNLTDRYRLERVPETLALQVIDRDMCDEVRTVHSLSGGESFLVSLALALGLSSLSSNRMKVESLFIDEGFGSLDSETLRIAMDALENLRTQGRKIGVISHVQEMTERIPVRIQVCRSGNGRSYLEVN